MRDRKKVLLLGKHAKHALEIARSPSGFRVGKRRILHVDAHLNFRLQTASNANENDQVRLSFSLLRSILWANAWWEGKSLLAEHAHHMSAGPTKKKRKRATRVVSFMSIWSFVCKHRAPRMKKKKKTTTTNKNNNSNAGSLQFMSRCLAGRILPSALILKRFTMLVGRVDLLSPMFVPMAHWWFISVEYEVVRDSVFWETKRRPITVYTIAWT